MRQKRLHILIFAGGGTQEADKPLLMILGDRLQRVRPRRAPRENMNVLRRNPFLF